MLTGDKLETAINIGLSTGLIQKNTVLFLYQADSFQSHLKKNILSGAPLNSVDASFTQKIKEFSTNTKDGASSFEQFQEELYNK
jgi:magnesium-transporting ATPase (P-type)